MTEKDANKPYKQHEKHRPVTPMNPLQGETLLYQALAGVEAAT